MLAAVVCALAQPRPGEGVAVSRPRPGAGVAINGNDVVAYFSLRPGEADVLGYPQHRRYVNASNRLPSEYIDIHPHPYEFWFANEANAETFAANPGKYIPAFGGHCTHGLASRNDLNASLVVDGRVAFTCVNTTRWVVRNGSLYMNSCGMYADFIKNPDRDIAAATSLWKKWYGGSSTGSAAVGPINDACFQDGGAWDGPPDWTGMLIPPKCVIN